MDKITPVLLVLTATVVGMYNCIQVVEIMNTKRDIILNIAERGEKISVDKKQFLYGDYFNFGIGVEIFLFIYAGAFAVLPFIFEKRAAETKIVATPSSTELTQTDARPLLSFECVGCWCAAAFGGFAFIVQLVACPIEMSALNGVLKRQTMILEQAIYVMILLTFAGATYFVLRKMIRSETIPRIQETTPSSKNE